jgi:hypothetical protein
MADSTSTLLSLRENLPNLPDKVLLLLECFGKDSGLTQLSNTPTLENLRKVVEASLTRLKVHLDGDTPDLPPGVSETEIKKLETYIQCRQHFLLGLSLQADRGVKLTQDLLDFAELYVRIRVRILQRAGEAALKERLQNRQFLSIADYNTLAALDWDSIGITNLARYASVTVNDLLSLYLISNHTEKLDLL